MQFQLQLESDWPPLAWIARCRRSDPALHVRHGPQVEVRNDWLCEAVWDGDFEGGGFDRTDLVFGSGIRLRGDRAVLVPAGATVDRLQFVELGGTAWVSNSMACLLAETGVEVDAAYGRYFDFFWSVTRGLDGYLRQVPTNRGRLEVAFFRNLVWDGERLSEEDKPNPARDLGSFEAYRNFLEAALVRMAANMAAETREHRYEMVSSISSGYDSTASTVLARAAGLRRAFSFRTARGGGHDHGEVMAQRLGLDLELVDRTAWRDTPFSEIPYLAVNGAGQDIIFSSADEQLHGRVLVSGFDGDRVWGKEKTHLAPDLARTSDGGLAFTEHRLQLGCIHLPVPGLGARQAREINEISHGPEMAAWDVPGDYSRPISRRIVEEAGIPRESFGMHKRAATNHFRRGEAVLTDETRSSNYRWLASHESLWRERGAKRTRAPGRFFWAFYDRYPAVRRRVRGLSRRLPRGAARRLLRIEDKFFRRMNRRVNLVEYLFPWAVHEQAKAYARRESNPGSV